MNILQVCQKFHHSVASGSTRVAYCISKELDRKGHLVVVYTSDMRDKYTRMDNGVEEINGVKVHRFRSIGTIFTRELKMLVTPKIITNLNNKSHSFDVIHMHEYRSFQNVIVHHYAKKYGVPYVLQAHGSLPRIMSKQKLKWIYDVLFGYRLLKDVSKVIALSQTEADQYKIMGVPEEKITIIPNGIDLSKYSNLPPRGCFRKKFDIGDNEKIVLYLGRIHRIKGIDILVEAFENIVRELNNIRLVIVGPDDGCLDEIKFMIETKNMKDKVLITGPLYGKDKLESYVDADVYVLPSRYETFPMTILEAYSCGKPVIASRVGALSDIITDGVTGLLFEPENIDQLTESLLSLLEDNTRAEQMGVKGKHLVKEKFNIEMIVDKIKELYIQIIE